MFEFKLQIVSNESNLNFIYSYYKTDLWSNFYLQKNILWTNYDFDLMKCNLLSHYTLVSKMQMHLSIKICIHAMVISWLMRVTTIHYHIITLVCIN
jgi:hypothetical protein